MLFTDKEFIELKIEVNQQKKVFPLLAAIIFTLQLLVLILVVTLLSKTM